MFNAINEMVQNPRRIMLVTEKRKKELESLHPYLKGRFKTKQELNKKTQSGFPHFPDEVEGTKTIPEVIEWFDEGLKKYGKK